MGEMGAQRKTYLAARPARLEVHGRLALSKVCAILAQDAAIAIAIAIAALAIGIAALVLVVAALAVGIAALVLVVGDCLDITAFVLVATHIASLECHGAAGDGSGGHEGGHEDDENGLDLHFDGLKVVVWIKDRL